MMIVMKGDATKEQIARIIERVEQAGATAHPSTGERHTVIGAIGDDPAIIAGLELSGEPGVEKVVPISKKYKLVSRELKPSDQVVRVGGVPIGAGNFGLIAGPCTVETREQTMVTAAACKAAGVSALRGGAFKPRSSPYTFQGLGEPALEILVEARAETGLPIVTELMDIRQLEAIVEVADMIQLGTRNMQNFDLLREVGRTSTPVLLKRGMASTIEEWLLAAEYIVSEGNDQVVLCERGIRTFETATRGTLDISAVPVAKSKSRLPVIVDPSHAAGQRNLIAPLARAAVVAGADGIIVEVHPTPETALCDGPQALYADGFTDWVGDIARFVEMMDKTIACPEPVGVGA